MKMPVSLPEHALAALERAGVQWHPLSSPQLARTRWLHLGKTWGFGLAALALFVVAFVALPVAASNPLEMLMIVVLWASATLGITLAVMAVFTACVDRHPCHLAQAQDVFALKQEGLEYLIPLYQRHLVRQGRDANELVNDDIDRLRRLHA